MLFQFKTFKNEVLPTPLFWWDVWFFKKKINFIESLFSDILSIFKHEDCPRKVSISLYQCPPCTLKATSQVMLATLLLLPLFLLAGSLPSNLVPGGRNSGTGVAFVSAPSGACCRAPDAEADQGEIGWIRCMKQPVLSTAEPYLHPQKSFLKITRANEQVSQNFRI